MVLFIFIDFNQNNGFSAKGNIKSSETDKEKTCQKYKNEKTSTVPTIEFIWRNSYFHIKIMGYKYYSK